MSIPQNVKLLKVQTKDMLSLAKHQIEGRL